MTRAARGGAWTLYLPVACMVLFWSGNYVAAKIAVAWLSPLLVTGLRIGLAGLAIAPFYALQQSSPRRRDAWTWREAPGLFALGVLGVTLNQLFFVVGISRTSVAHAGMITALGPVCVLIIAAALRMERITGRQAAGMLMSLAGVIVLQIWREGGASRPTPLGDLIVFLGTFTFALFTAFNKRIAHLRTALTVNTFAYVGGALILAPLTAFQLLLVKPGAPPFVWATVAYMALFPSVAAYLIFSWALKRLPASHLAMFSYLQPLCAVVLAAMILHEPVEPPVLWGGCLILAGVAVTELARRSRPSAPESVAA